MLLKILKKKFIKFSLLEKAKIFKIFLMIKKPSLKSVKNSTFGKQPETCP